MNTFFVVNRKLRSIFLLILFVIFIAPLTVKAQPGFFTDADETVLKSGNIKRDIIPLKYRTLSLDNGRIKSFLTSLPGERNINRDLAPILLLPMPDGTVARFRVWESSIQEPGLQEKFPEIRTFAGQGIDDPYASIRFDYNPYTGFHGQVISPNGRVYLDPYARGDIKHYISYYHRDNKRNAPFSCLVPENASRIINQSSTLATGPCRGTQLYTYRLAVACTGEYAVAVGGTNASLLHAAIVTTVNRVDGVYESELSIRLVLIATNNLIEFTDAATDPFNGNDDANTLITESQTQITNRIGSANFDIGHTFSTGAGGLAGLGVVCTTSLKARGVTGSSSPFGDGYDIDYVAHEIGHQFGGNHTFNSVTSSCGSGNRNASTAYEVGSGTTIQAYAGICSTDNTQPNSDPFFHTISFDEISNYVESGGTCKVATATGNTLPVISAMNNNGANIPLNTPFTLTASATDANADALTYCWEEWDLGAGGAWNSGAASTTAPLFKSRIPKTSGSRTFPDMAVILAGYPANPSATMGGLKGETLPTVARAIKFRLTVRDNRSGGGGVVTGGNGCQAGFTAAFQVNTIAATGPFIVTAPNGGESYTGNSTQTITWNVAGTSASPISTANVKISLSTDGGLTYPTVLSASTANDGSEALTIPNTPTTTARIKVEAVGNIFFDISNANFTITSAPATGFDFSNPAATNITCNGPSSATITLGTTAYGGYSTAINLSATAGVPAGTTVGFSVNPLTPGNSTVVTLNNTNTLAAGNYDITITGISGAITQTRIITFTVQTGTAPTITSHPANQAVCAGANAPFSIATSGVAVTGYQWQRSIDGGINYTNIAGATSSSYTQNAVTLSQNSYRYRVIVSGQCGSVTSNAAILTVTAAPSTPVTTPASSTICLGQIQSLSASSSIANLFQFGTQAATNTTSSSSTDYPAPYSAWYGGQRMQILILASELTNAGFVTGSQLTNLQFPVISLGSGWGTTITSLQSFKVSMGETGLTTLTSFQSGLTPVVAAANFTPVVGYNNTHTFSSPFTWNGGNLIIETTFSNNIAGNTPTNVVEYNSPTGFQSCIVYRADGVTAATAAASTIINYSLTSRPDLKLNGSTVAPITWSPTTGLYTDAAASITYTGTIAPLVYAKPAATGTSSFTAIATGAGCTSNANAILTVSASASVPAGSGASRCGTGTVTISATPGIGETIDWYAAASGGSALQTGSNSFTTPSISTTTTYYAEARNISGGCVSATRTAVVASITGSLPAPTGTGAARCGTGTVTISATPGAGDTVDWYAAASGGSALQSGSTSYTTGSISVTTTYYAEARNPTTGCISASRTAVVASVNTIPAVPSGTGNARCGTGTVAISATPGAGETIDWYAAASGGSALLTGNTSFTTPSISATTTYYAEARNTTTGCIPATRTAVVATVNTIPAAPTGIPNTRCGTGTVTISATPGAGETIDWYAASGGSALLTGNTSFTTPSISATTTYYAEARNTTTGCISATRTAVAAIVGSVPATPSSLSGTRCGTGTVTISSTPGTGQTIDWYAAASGGSALLVGNTSFTTPSISVTTTYYAEARHPTTGCVSATRKSVVANVNALPAAPTGTNNSRCGTGTVVISASVAAGVTIDWYATASGGSALQSGSTSYTTLSISTTTTYYAEARNTTTGCISATRTAVVATVNAVPAAPPGSGTSRCGSGTVAISATPGAGETIDWYAAASGGSALQSGSTSFTTPSISVTTTYYAQARNTTTGCVSATRTAVVATVNTLPALPAGTNSSRCGTGTVVISATPGAGETIDWYAAASGGSALQSGSTSYTTPSISITTTYYAQARNTTTGCVSATRTAVTATVSSCSVTLNLTLYIQGYYNNGGFMRPVLNNQGMGALSTETDTITVELHNSSAPYALSTAPIKKVLNTNGTASLTFPVSGSYYIVVKHRNSIETWSAAAVPLSGTVSYDFSTGAAKAYGNNMVQIGNIWAIYCGDVNGDGNIDASDYSLWETDYNDFASGYYVTDLNGDGNVDASDYSIWEANYNNFIGVARP